MADSTAVFPPGFRLVDTNGRPIPGAQIEFYQADTDAALEVFSDSELTETLGNIVYTDSAGYPVTAENGTTKAIVFVGTAAYKVVIKNTSGTQIATHPRIPGAVVAGGGGGGGGSGITQDAADLRYVRNPNALGTLTGLDAGDLISFWDASASLNKAITQANFQSDLISKMRTAGAIITVGTRAPFQQTNPPTGWTKETGSAYNDATFKLVTGAVATGGSSNFSTVFDSRALSGTVGSFTLAIADTPAHTHVANSVLATAGVSASSGGGAGDLGTVVNRTTTSIGGSTAHAHSLIMNNLNMDTKFAAFTIGIKS